MTKKNKIILFGGLSVITISYIIYNKWSKRLFYEEVLKRIDGGSIRFEELIIWQPNFLLNLKSTGRNYIEYQQQFLRDKAIQLEDALSGLGTDEKSVNAVFNSFDSKSGMAQFINFYNAKYRTNLKDVLNSELDSSEKQNLSILISQKPNVIYL